MIEILAYREAVCPGVIEWFAIRIPRGTVPVFPVFPVKGGFSDKGLFIEGENLRFRISGTSGKDIANTLAIGIGQ